MADDIRLDEWFSVGGRTQKLRFKDRTEYKIDGEFHNPYGPAIIYNNGETVYYINGEKIEKEEHEAVRLKAVRKRKVNKLAGDIE